MKAEKGKDEQERERKRPNQLDFPVLATEQMRC